MQSVLGAGFELVEVNLAPVWSEKLLAEWAQHLRPGPTYLILRINLRGGYTPIGHDAPYYGEKLQRQDLDGKLAEDARLLEPTDAWVDYCVETIRAIAQGLDALLPHRIIGLRPELVGENFMRPIRLSSNGVQLAMDGATVNSANPHGFWDDYSPDSHSAFLCLGGTTKPAAFLRRSNSGRAKPWSSGCKLSSRCYSSISRSGIVQPIPFLASSRAC